VKEGSIGDFSGQHKHTYMMMMIATTRERERKAEKKGETFESNKKK